MKTCYLEVIGLIERLHRRCLDVVGTELDRLGIRELNAVQAMLIFNLGDREMTMGELIDRGYYLGSNVSYNIKKMVEMGYVIQERSPYDRRSFYVRASDKGLELWHHLDALFERHVEELATDYLDEERLALGRQALGRLEGYWSTARHGSLDRS